MDGVWYELTVLDGVGRVLDVTVCVFDDVLLDVFEGVTVREAVALGLTVLNAVLEGVTVGV